MASFLFQAKTADGKMIKGEVLAEDENEARLKIRSKKLLPLKLVPKSAGAGALKSKQSAGQNHKVSSKDLQIFTRQFSVLVGAGVPIVQSMEALRDGAKSQSMTEAIQIIINSLERGNRLGESLELLPKMFDTMYVNLVKAGEEGGVLDEILDRLAIYIEKSVKLKGKITGAMWYPAAIIGVAALVISAILIFVIPQFVSIFSSSGKELPQLTQIVMSLSEGFQEYWYIVIGVLVGTPVGLKKYYESPEGRKVMDAVFIATPVLGALVQKGAVARFSRTLATLLSAGVRILDSIDIAASTTGNSVISDALMKSKDSISKGKTLSEPLKKEKYIPDMVSHMLSIGEETGNMDQMLTKIADFYEDEVENAAEALTSVIEPLLMVVLGGIIAFLVIAMYLPVFNLAGSMG